MIGVVFGGDSLEHEVSLASAKDMIEALSAKSFYLKKDGQWEVSGKVVGDVVFELKKCDVVIPMFHGGFGEDGTFQGFLEMNNIPYVGCGVKASAICMDKDLTKRVLKSHGVKTEKFSTVFSLEEAKRLDVKMPCVIKAASLGSSVGVYKVYEDPLSAFEKAFAICDKVLMEEMVEGRELWVSALEENGELILSDPCEIEPKGGMFTYENKYLEEDGAIYHVPAVDVDKEKIGAICKRFLGSLVVEGWQGLICL